MKDVEAGGHSLDDCIGCFGPDDRLLVIVQVSDRAGFSLGGGKLAKLKDSIERWVAHRQHPGRLKNVE